MDRQLINYLPYAIREFEDFQGITTGEQPEFELVWDAQQQVFDNQFIDTAGDYGLNRWEKMLKIFPKGTDTLETRRARIKTKLNNFVPYTIRVLAQMITAIADGEPFTLTLEPGTYLLTLITEWGASGQIEGLEYLIENILPCNIAVDAQNRLLCVSEGVALAIGGVCFVNHFFITNDGVERKTIYGVANIGGGFVGAETLFITNDSREQMETTGEMFTRGGVVHAVCPSLTNDSVETHALDGAAAMRGGVVDSAVVVITNDFNEKFNLAGTTLTGGGTVKAEIIEIKSDFERMNFDG